MSRDSLLHPKYYLAYRRHIINMSQINEHMNKLTEFSINLGEKVHSNLIVG